MAHSAGPCCKCSETRNRNSTKTGTKMTDGIISISSNNDSVDFNLLKNKSNVIAVIHKATGGLNEVDKEYMKRYEEANSVGMLWGAYHCGTNDSGGQQAIHFLKSIGNTKELLLALILDPEHSPPMNPKEAEEFVRKIKCCSKRYPVLYGPSEYLEYFGNFPLTECPLWVSSLEAEPVIPKKFSNFILWEHTREYEGADPTFIRGVGFPNGKSKFVGSLDELSQMWSLYS